MKYLVRYDDYTMNTLEQVSAPPGMGIREVVTQTTSNGLAKLDLSDRDLNFMGCDWGHRN